MRSLRLHCGSFCSTIVKLAFQEIPGVDIEGGEEVLDGQYYMLYAFIKGTFVLHGDGGFNNFCCSGKYSKSGNRYTFY